MTKMRLMNFECRPIVRLMNVGYVCMSCVGNAVSNVVQRSTIGDHLIQALYLQSLIDARHCRMSTHLT